MSTFRTLLPCLILALASCGGRSEAPPAGDTFLEMTRIAAGVSVSVTLRGPGAAGHVGEVTAALDEIERILGVLDAASAGSELARLNASAGGGPMVVGRDLWDALGLALDLARRTSGAYDPTVGDPGGWRAVELHPPTRAIGLRAKGLRVELGGVAHGFAAQAAWALLGSRGVTRCLVRVGDVAVAGEAPTLLTPGWALAADGDVRVRLAGRAMARHEGSREATVITGDAATAAGLARVLAGLPWKEGIALATSAPGVEARVTADEGPAETLGFRAYVAP